MDAWLRSHTFTIPGMHLAYDTAFDTGGSVAVANALKNHLT